ncbi:hypothetical protein IFM89_019559 [Coptis chinensis]|uniref:Uncharacterized protein n=1 Tax=Coptis chinensis TaxID=261450 RepID=A0A835HZU3_9MAGN|nr:hypothetical protein IFM89_019559 [Coptis chinensis]
MAQAYISDYASETFSAIRTVQGLVNTFGDLRGTLAAIERINFVLYGTDTDDSLAYGLERDKYEKDRSLLQHFSEVTSKQCEDPASIQLELYWGEIASHTHSNYVLEQSNNSVQIGASTKDAPQVESSVAKRGDILIDINNRFPRDFCRIYFQRKDWMKSPLA